MPIAKEPEKKEEKQVTTEEIVRTRDVLKVAFREAEKQAKEEKDDKKIPGVFAESF